MQSTPNYMPPVLIPEEITEAPAPRDLKGDAFEALFALKLDHPAGVSDVLKEFAKQVPQNSPKDLELRDLAVTRFQSI